MFKPLLLFYMTGIVVTELLNVISLLSSISIMLSMRSKNLKKVGFYYDLSAGKFTQDKITIGSTIFILIDMFIISPLLSWYPAIRVIWFWFKSRGNKVQVPEKLKELQFQLASIDLPKIKVEKVLADIRQIAASYGSIDNSEEYLDGNTLMINDRNEMRISPTQKMIRHSWHSPDYDSTGESIYEYRLKEFNVETRVIEKFSGEYTIKEKNIYSIKDNVVLESEIRERAKNDKFTVPFGESLDEMISNLKAETEWSNLPSSKMKYFIQSRHAYDFSEIEFRQYIRKELERYKSGLDRINELAIQNGYIVKTDDYGTSIHYPDGLDDNTISSLREKYKDVFPDELFVKIGFTKSEFNNSGELVEYLSELIEENN